MFYESPPLVLASCITNILSLWVSAWCLTVIVGLSLNASVGFRTRESIDLTAAERRLNTSSSYSPGEMSQGLSWDQKVWNRNSVVDNVSVAPAKSRRIRAQPSWWQGSWRSVLSSTSHLSDSSQTL